MNKQTNDLPRQINQPHGTKTDVVGSIKEQAFPVEPSTLKTYLRTSSNDLARAVPFTPDCNHTGDLRLFTNS